MATLFVKFQTLKKFGDVYKRQVGIPAEEVHLVTLEVGLDPGVERLTLPVLDHARCV